MRRRWPIVCVLLALAGAAGAHAPPEVSVPAATAGAGEPFRRGMTVSCPTWGPIWGSPAMAEALAELRGLGVGWVAIHPYAGVRRSGEIRSREAASVGFLERAAELSRRAGVELFWKPHLAYWGSFEWRGEITFDDEAAWRLFFDGYERFIVDQARFAQQMGVGLFAVGTELEATTHREEEWRRIVARVREVYRGRLTYAANWDRLDKVPFWDALDLVGVQAYFPLSHAEAPRRPALADGWETPLAELRRLSARHGGKRVLFTEIGYDLTPAAAREPWSSGRGRGGEGHRELRRQLIEVALERLEREPVVAGMFWWKWIPGPEHTRDDFSMRRPEALEALRAAWGSGTGAARVTGQ